MSQTVAWYQSNHAVFAGGLQDNGLCWAKKRVEYLVASISYYRAILQFAVFTPREQGKTAGNTYLLHGQSDYSHIYFSVAVIHARQFLRKSLAFGRFSLEKTEISGMVCRFFSP
jgi:hypothetical protein